MQINVDERPNLQSAAFQDNSWSLICQQSVLNLNKYLSIYKRNKKKILEELTKVGCTDTP